MLEYNNFYKVDFCLCCMRKEDVARTLCLRVYGKPYEAIEAERNRIISYTEKAFDVFCRRFERGLDVFCLNQVIEGASMFEMKMMKIVAKERKERFYADNFDTLTGGGEYGEPENFGDW